MRLKPQSGDRVPLTVIGGFLGAGKTTFLNRLLANATGRTAVLVNDFGAINVDAGLIADHDGKTLRLTNGCVCCSLADGFLDTLLRVLAEPFDDIVIETSGVGDPWAIAEIALVEPGLRLGGVIVLADAERLTALLSDLRIGETVRRQIKAADIVILNKADLVDAHALARARAAIELEKPNARIVESVLANVPFDLIDFDATARTGSQRRATSGAHEDLFRRLLYRHSLPFDRTALDTALAALPSSLLRLKGEVALGRSAEPHLLQMVGARFALTPVRTGAAMGGTELAGIGTTDLDERTVVRILDSVVMQQVEIASGEGF